MDLLPLRSEVTLSAWSVRWSVLRVHLVRIREAETAGETGCPVCLWGCFWKKLAFGSGHHVKAPVCAWGGWGSCKRKEKSQEGQASSRGRRNGDFITGWLDALNALLPASSRNWPNLLLFNFSLSAWLALWLAWVKEKRCHSIFLSWFSWPERDLWVRESIIQSSWVNQPPLANLVYSFTVKKKKKIFVFWTHRLANIAFDNSMHSLLVKNHQYLSSLNKSVDGTKKSCAFLNRNKLKFMMTRYRTRMNAI